MLTPALCATLLQAARRGLAPSARRLVLRAVQPRLRAQPRAAIVGGAARACSATRASADGRLRRDRRACWLCCSCACRRASCREEDQGGSSRQITLPPAPRSRARSAVAKQVEHYYLADEKRQRARRSSPSSGFSFAGAGQNAGHGVRRTSKDWDERTGADNSAAGDRRGARLQDLRARLRDAQIFALMPPPVRGLGTVDRLRHGARRSRRHRPRRADGRARPVARRRAQEPDPHAGAAQRARRHAAAQPRHRSGESERARHLDRRHQHDARPPRGAAPTSTTSSIAAGSSACTCRAMRRSAWRRRI